MTKPIILLILIAQTILSFTYPNWPLKVISWDIDKAYPGIEYKYRLGVQGGYYPYRFYLTTAPSGMVIDSMNGTITWTPAGESNDNDVVVKIRNKNRTDSLTHSFQIDVAASSFKFVSTAGSNSNDGSVGSPYLTLAYATTHASSTQIVYVRAGTYSESTLSINSTGCAGFIAYPGETVNVNLTSTTNACIDLGGSNKVFMGINFDAGNKRWLFSCAAVHDVSWVDNTMHNVYSNDEENPSFIFFWDGYSGRTNLYVAGNSMYDIDNPYEHGGSVITYAVRDLVMEDNRIDNIRGYGIDDKLDNRKNTYRNNTISNTTMDGLALLTYELTDSIIVQNNTLINERLTIGSGDGPITNVWVFNNNALHIFSHTVINRDDNENINIFKNALKGSAYCYRYFTIDSSGTGIFPRYISHDNGTFFIDSNLCYSSSSDITVATWEPPTAKNWSQWQAMGWDVHGLNVDFPLTDSGLIRDTSDYYNIFGVYTDTAVAGEPEPEPDLEPDPDVETTINIIAPALDSGLVLKGDYTGHIDSVKISGVKQTILLQNDTVIKIRQPYLLSPTNQVRNLNIYAGATNWRYYIRYTGDRNKQVCHITSNSGADTLSWVNAFSTDFNTDTVENTDTTNDKFVSKNTSAYINNLWNNDSIIKFTGNKINSIKTVKYSDGLGSTRRKASIVNDPSNPFNRVCRMWGDTTSYSSFRIQSEISSPWETGIKKLRYTVRLFVPYKMSVLKNMSAALGWFTIAEFWNDVAHTSQPDEKAFRLTIGIGKNAGVGEDLHFIVSTDSFSVNEGVYTQHRIVDTIIESFTIPFDQWMTLEYYYNDDAYDTQTDTSFYMTVTQESGSKQTLFSDRIRLHSLYNTSGRGLTFLSPIKMYCAQSTVGFITTNNGGLGSELFYDDLKIWIKE